RRLPQHDLDVARVLAGGEVVRAWRGLDCVEADDAALGLRDDLVRHDEHVAVLEPARSLGSLAQQDGEVVALGDLRDPFERDDPELGQLAGAATSESTASASCAFASGISVLVTSGRTPSSSTAAAPAASASSITSASIRPT